MCSPLFIHALYVARYIYIYYIYSGGSLAQVWSCGRLAAPEGRRKELKAYGERAVLQAAAMLWANQGLTWQEATQVAQKAFGQKSGSKEKGGKGRGKGSK